MTTRRLSFGQYARFLIVGAFVGIVTVGCRELIGHLLVVDNRQTYSLSIVLAYAIGIALSFLLNQRFTFGGSSSPRSWSRFAGFVVLALLGMALTWLISLLLRYGLHLDALLGERARMAAFAGGALLSSALIYPLNSLFVFSGRRLAGSSAYSRLT